jgi:hypothetical protein
MASAARCSELLRRTGLFPDEEVSTLLSEHRAESGSLTQRIVDSGRATEEVYLSKLAEAMLVPYQRLMDATPPPDVLSTLPAKAVYQYQVLPLAVENGVLRVATHDPFRPGLSEALRLSSGQRIRFALAPHADLEKAIKRLYGVGGETIEQMIDEGGSENMDEDLLDADLADLDEEASVVKFVNQII